LSGVGFLLAAYTLPKDLKLAEDWRINRRGTDGSAQLTGVTQTGKRKFLTIIIIVNFFKNRGFVLSGSFIWDNFYM